MSSANCLHCGKEIREGELYCPACQAISGTPRPRFFRIFIILFSTLLFALTGLLLWHGGLGAWSFSLDSILGKPAAMINGEAIARADLKARIKSIRAMVERQYGKDIFTGERGRVLLANLKYQVLEEMMEERLVAQEAQRLGIQISNQAVQQEIQRVSKEIYGTWENFQARLREDGVSKEELQNHIRNLLLYKALKIAKTPAGANQDVSFNAWLIQAKQKAEVAIYEAGDLGGATSSAMGGCCGPDGSSGDSGGRGGIGGPVNQQTEEEAKKVALDAFRKSYPPGSEVTAKVTNYGCHIQVDIQKEGKIVRSYTYQGGKAFEIS